MVYRYDTKLQKKKKEDDSAIVQTMDMDWLDVGHCSVLSLVALLNSIYMRTQTNIVTSCHF